MTTPRKLDVLKLALRERQDPDPYYAALAQLTVEGLGVPLDGVHVLDLGCGTGWNSRALREAGATVTGVDLEPTDVVNTASRGTQALVGDALALPFRDSAFGGVLCSNTIEHVPSVDGFFTETARVLRPGGWAWISWTNWWSPWGGHNIIPFHLLGPQLGPRVYERCFGPPPKNVPGEGLFPTYVGRMIAQVRADSRFEVVDTFPRYYPSQRWILRVPGVREVATWNCVLVLRRT